MFNCNAMSRSNTVFIVGQCQMYEMLLSSLPVADGRHGIVRVDRVPLACKLVELPCMIESLKTVDKKTFYKTADVCQVNSTAAKKVVTLNTFPIAK